MTTILNKPTPAFIGASWVALFAGAAAFLIGLWNAQLSLHEKGYYLTVIFMACLRQCRYKKLSATS